MCGIEQLFRCKQMSFRIELKSYLSRILLYFGEHWIQVINTNFADIRNGRL